MSSMEIDIPTQVNGLMGTETVHSPRQKVHFVNADEIKTYRAIEQRPKHKARRRARVPKLENGEPAPKPISPAKLKKTAEKDRHSRTGFRGLPKKGRLGFKVV